MIGLFQKRKIVLSELVLMRISIIYVREVFIFNIFIRFSLIRYGERRIGTFFLIVIILFGEPTLKELKEVWLWIAFLRCSSVPIFLLTYFHEDARS